MRNAQPRQIDDLAPVQDQVEVERAWPPMDVAGTPESRLDRLEAVEQVQRRQVRFDFGRRVPECPSGLPADRQRAMNRTGAKDPHAGRGIELRQGRCERLIDPPDISAKGNQAALHAENPEFRIKKPWAGAVESGF